MNNCWIGVKQQSLNDLINLQLHGHLMPLTCFSFERCINIACYTIFGKKNMKGYCRGKGVSSSLFSSRVNMSLHSGTLFWFRANQFLLFLLNAACLAEKQQIPILKSASVIFDPMLRLWLRKLLVLFNHMSTCTCFIQKIYAPSSSLLQGKHLPFTPSPLSTSNQQSLSFCSNNLK
jgi:hypothetical protein